MIAVELAAHHVPGRKRPNPLKHFDFFVLQTGIRHGHRGFHGHVGEQLEQMVLHHVPNRAGLLIERSAASDTEVFRHRDLHALDEVPVPDRLHESVGEAEKQDVLDRVLSQVVIDAKDILLREGRVEILFKARAESRSCPKGFSTTTRAPFRASGGF